MDVTRELAMFCLLVMAELIVWRIYFPVSLYTHSTGPKIYPVGTAVRVSFPEIGEMYKQAIVIACFGVVERAVYHRVLVLGEAGFTFSITIFDPKNITCWNEPRVWDDWCEKNREYLKFSREVDTNEEV